MDEDKVYLIEFGGVVMLPTQAVPLLLALHAGVSVHFLDELVTMAMVAWARGWRA